MRWIADLVYLVTAVLYLPLLAWQMIVQGKNRRGWSERLGLVRFRPTSAGRIWVHGVSLGEINATRRIVQELAERYPNREVVISSTTDTGYARACSLYGPDRVFRFPLDFSVVISRVLRRLNPTLIVLMELEVWYNLTTLAAVRGVRIAVANGRLTKRSASRLAKLGWCTRSMFQNLDWVGAQDQPTADRFISLGTPVDRVQVTGSMKWDTATVFESVQGADAIAAALGVDSNVPLWVCGSTGPGEEAIILDAFRALLDGGVCVSLVIVPRKPERFDEVARLIRRRSFECVRRRDNPDGVTRRVSATGREVLLGDSVGELRKFYALSRVSFVGRSLVDMGGSDPIEVAALGKPVLCGSHMDNFSVAVDALRGVGGLTVVNDASELVSAVREYLTDSKKARDSGQAAREVVVKQQGATGKSLAALARLV